MKKISFINISKIFFGFNLLILTLLATPSSAQKEVGIAAIVGESAISNIDLQERIKIAMFASNMAPGKGIEEKLVPQVLQNLIDERLYMKEAATLGIEVSNEEISNVMADLEKRNNIQPGKFTDFLKFNGISPATMTQQLKSQITWSKVVARKIRPQISVSEKEIEEKMENISRQSIAEELNISEILLTVNGSNDEKKVKELADKLVKQLREGGNFASVAKQFSKASSATNGGDAGWVRVGQLTDEIAKNIKTLNPGDISSPIKIAEGYSILKLNERRAVMPSATDSQIGLRHAFVALAKDATAADLTKMENDIQKKQAKIKSCEEFTSFAKDIGSTADTQMVTSKISDLSSDVSENVSKLKIGTMGKPISSSDGLNIYMVCERTDAAAVTALRGKIREAMFMKKLEIQANRYLRDLRRGAFIEIRI